LSLFWEHAPHQPQSGRAGGDLEALAGVENQFKLSLAWRMRFGDWRRGFDQRESDRLLSKRAELPPPPVEGSSLSLCSRQNARTVWPLFFCFATL
jgi:hypothetical protein